MSDQFNEFQKRVGQINRTHRRRVPYKFSVREDGLLVPRTRSSLRFYFPWRAILAGFVTVVAVKAFMIYYLSPEGYDARVNGMLVGSAYYEVASTILSVDPVSAWTAERLGDLMARINPV